MLFLYLESKDYCQANLF